MALLPKAFFDLEPFAADWCLPNEAARYARRLSAPMEEIQAFYDAVTPRARAAIEYCNQFPLDAMPDDAINLMHLLYSMILVSFAVECWRQARIPDSGAAVLECRVAPVP